MPDKEWCLLHAAPRQGKGKADIDELPIKASIDVLLTDTLLVCA